MLTCHYTSHFHVTAKAFYEVSRDVLMEKYFSSRKFPKTTDYGFLRLVGSFSHAPAPDWSIEGIPQECFVGNETEVRGDGRWKTNGLIEIVLQRKTTEFVT